MNFINHTPFPALAFEGVDQDQRAFHVVVLRQTLSFADGALAYAAAQAPLCDADTDLADGAGVRQESDLCQRKPNCDILVNATAYAPQGKPRTAFTVRLTLRGPDSAAHLPRRPQGLNQFEDAAPAVMARWRAQVKHAERHPVPGLALLDKSLRVTGARQFRKKSWVTRTLHWIVRLGTLGLLRPTPWKLTRPQVVATLPLNDGYAFGGESRINAGDPAAARVPARHRASPAASAAHPERAAAPSRQPVLHTVCEKNLHGAGFVDPIYLKATRVRAVTAPQIERIGATLDARLFWRALRGRLKGAARDAHAAFEPAGFGCRAKSHPARRKLAGTVDQAFASGDDALPKNFDFAFWNAAREDQQTPFLRNDEVIELVNLCAPGTTGMTLDADGNSTLRLALLRHECFVLCRQDDGALFRQALALDTLLVEPDAHTLTLVWRGAIEKNGEAPMRACEARMHSHLERDRMARERAAIEGAFAAAAAPAPATKGVAR
jgi:hypothetical protein